MIISIAPMMDRTDRHERYFLRQIAPSIHLYTEMVTAKALIHGDVDYLLGFHPSEKYVALQLGGSDPKELAYSATLGERFGYDEINLNVGCPSPRVTNGRFGACLMLEPALVADCVRAMQEVVTIPVTVKCRIGVDETDSYEALVKFIQTIVAAGCETFIIHARKAWLSGLSPKENREIPPLSYETVWQIKKDFPKLTIIINGGISTVNQIDQQLNHVDGVMIGRAAYASPYFLTEIQQRFYPFGQIKTRYDIIQSMLPYIEKELVKGVRLNSMTRHLLGLYNGQPGASLWRRYLSQHAHKANAGINVIEEALTRISQ